MNTLRVDLDFVREWADALANPEEGEEPNTGLAACMLSMARELEVARAVVEAAGMYGDRFSDLAAALAAYRAHVGGTVKPAHWPISWSQCRGCDKPAEHQDQSGLKWCPACREKNHRKEVARDP